MRLEKKGLLLAMVFLALGSANNLSYADGEIATAEAASLGGCGDKAAVNVPCDARETDLAKSYCEEKYTYASSEGQVISRFTGLSACQRTKWETVYALGIIPTYYSSELQFNCAWYDQDYVDRYFYNDHIIKGTWWAACPAVSK